MDVVETTQRLIQFPSVTTESNKEISTFLQVELGRLGFELEILPYQDLAGRDKVAIVAMRQPPGGADSGRDRLLRTQRCRAGIRVELSAR